jgi:AAA ATPase domain
VKISQLTVAGFRGFNAPRTLVFNERLTLLSAANSYGKTSITEALEFLIYGQTSKVEAAASKDEYKDSYLNRHYPDGSKAFVEAVCRVGSRDVTLRVETDGESVGRFLDGKPVPSWPFDSDAATAARPFVVQHSLKALLLSNPLNRFQGFARLLGLQHVDDLQQAFVNLCTKPDAHLPRRAQDAVRALETFETRLKVVGGNAAKVAKEFGRGAAGIPKAYELLHARGEALLGKRVPEDGVHDALVTLRNAAASKVFAGSVSIHSLDSEETKKTASDRAAMLGIVDSGFKDAYQRLADGDQADKERRVMKLLELGTDLLADSPERCPFCLQGVTTELTAHIKERHSTLVSRLGALANLEAERVRLLTLLNNLKKAVADHCTVLRTRCDALIAAATPEQNQKLKALIARGNEDALFSVASAGAAAATVQARLRRTAAVAYSAVEVAAASIGTRTENRAHIVAIGTAIDDYLLTADEYSTELDSLVPTLIDASRLLKEAVDAQAGTAEMSLLIELFHDHVDVARGVRVREVLQGLKDLRKQVDQATGETMEAAFATVLTGAVMEWYDRIRTTGDPDVHFSGFSMDKTTKGDFKNRRVRVEARSYGVELASAVSSLSESKLNALGLCMSIATSLRFPGPWAFLVLDDPIQSWDDEHEIQFISIIRALAEDMGKQVILLSHRDRWIDAVAANLRSLNGTRYQITGYTKDGPVITAPDWTTIDQRLEEMLAIAKDPAATPIRLQQAEEEVRLAACQLAAEVSNKRLNRPVNASSLNSTKARSILVQAGCPIALTDRVSGTFVTTDDAHHAPKNYAAVAERIRQYHGALSELRNWLKSGK